MKFTKSTARKNKAKANKTGVVPSLAKEIIKDLLVRQVVISGLLVILVASAMLQAQMSHQVRKAVTESQTLREKIQKAQIQAQALRLEMTSLSEADRVASLASKKLGMIDVTSDNERIISLLK